ncbi:MAG: hypothetical protein GX295_09325 [Syntrophomonadaceae bacterium]|nr:hypothetical protein [Syntrophomonadaceae bacterium]
MKCPVCNGVQTGKIGAEQYYCWNCFVEFSMQNNSLEVYEVAEDGSLLAYDSPLDQSYSL